MNAGPGIVQGCGPRPVGEFIQRFQDGRDGGLGDFAAVEASLRRLPHFETFFRPHVSPVKDSVRLEHCRAPFPLSTEDGPVQSRGTPVADNPRVDDEAWEAPPDAFRDRAFEEWRQNDVRAE